MEERISGTLGWDSLGMQREFWGSGRGQARLSPLYLSTKILLLVGFCPIHKRLQVLICLDMV